MKGWKCPECGRVWAPWVTQCRCHVCEGDISYPIERRYELDKTIKPQNDIPQITTDYPDQHSKR